MTTMHAVGDVIAQRGITDVLHFTTNHGLVGAGDRGLLLSRDRLEASARLEHVYSPNCADRLKDAEWTDYINLSITAVNNHMLGTSHRWHHHKEDLWWAVLKFEADLLTHPDVHFVTTNNTYTDSLLRGTGASALEALFAPQVMWGHYRTVIHRPSTQAPNLPTHLQAEVLYPRQLSLGHLTGIYVPLEDLIDEVHALQAVFTPLAGVPVEYRPEVFQ